MKILVKALEFAEKKHFGQFRKDGVTPAISHLRSVVDFLRQGGIEDEILLVGAALHDTIEDTETTKQEIQEEFGTVVLKLVEEVSDNKSYAFQVRKDLQIENASKKSKRACNLKIADFSCNLRDVLLHPAPDWTSERKLQYAYWTENVVANLKTGKAKLLKEYYHRVEEVKKF